MKSEKVLPTTKAEELLLELLQISELSEATEVKKLYGEWREAIIGIGADHTATILIDVEDFEVLEERSKKVSKSDRDGKVINLPIVTTLDQDPDRTLDDLKGKLEGFFIIGYDKGGEEFFNSTYADGGTVLWLMERMKLKLLNAREE